MASGATPPSRTAPGARPRNPLTAPLTVADVERGLNTAWGRADRVLSALALPLFLAALALALLTAWRARVSSTEARCRAEALAFQLTLPPRLSPPMAVTPSWAAARGGVAPTATAEEALRQAMHFDDSLVLLRGTRRVGDFEVCTLWLRLPGQPGHWLVAGWRERGELQVLNLQVASEETVPTDEEIRWGERILGRVLVPANFRARGFPRTRARLPGKGAALPALGPGEP